MPVANRSETGAEWREVPVTGLARVAMVGFAWRLMSARAEEQALITAAKTGDEQAVLDLVDRYQGAVYRFGKRMCPTEEDAEDVVQETLLTAVQKLADFRGDASFTSWLFTIVRSRCSRKHRAAAKSPVLEPIEMIDERPHPDELLNQHQLRQGLEAALATIEPMYREVLLMRDVEGMTAPEVAATLDLSVAAVKSRLHRARGMLRERIEKMFNRPLPKPKVTLPAGQELGEVLSSYLEGDLTKAQCAALEAQLADSPDCQGACDLLRRILGECQACQRDKPPERLQESIRGAIRAVIARGPDEIA